MSAKGKGKSVVTAFARHRHLKKTTQNPFSAITKSAIKRAAHYSGIGYVTQSVQTECRAFLEDVMTSLIKDAFIYTNNRRRVQVSDEDVLYAAEELGYNLYGMQTNANFKPNAMLNMKKKKRVVAAAAAAAPVEVADEEDDDANDADYVAA